MSEDDRPVVQASEILAKIEKVEDVDIKMSLSKAISTLEASSY